jgi:ABC-type transport system substrate-binding protein
MTSHRLTSPKALIFAPLILLLVIAAACGGTAATPVVVQKEVIKEVVKEVPVIKEVIKEVVKEVVVVATAVPVAKVEEASAKEQAAAEAAAGMAVDPDFNPIYGGIINMAQYADVRQRLIHQSSVLNMTMSPVFNNLVEWNPETDDVSDLRCDMCTSWELADDGRTYTFRIHEDAKWHDGVPVTAADIVFSMESMVNPDQFKVLEGRSTSSHANAGLYYETGNSRAIDDKTVEIVTKFPSGGFLLAIANETAPIIPRHTVVDQEIAQGGRDLKVLNGSGPFKLTEYVKEVSVSYEKDPNYWKTDRNGNARPYIDGIKMFIITDSGRQIAAFKTEQVLTANQSIDNLSSQEALKLDEEMDNLTVHWTGPAQAFYVAMNTTYAPFDDVRVRRALHLALHRQPIIQTFSGGTDALGYPNPEGFWYSQTAEEYANMPGFRELNGEKHPDDLAEAKRLMVEAGIPDGLKVTLTTRNVLGYPDLGVQVKEQLKEALGWDIKIQVMESGAGFDAYWAGDVQFFVQSGGIFSTGPDAIWARLTRGTVPQWTGGGRGKFMVPCSETTGKCLDELNDLQMRELDQEKRASILAEMSELVINEDHSNPYLFWANHHHAVNHKIQNFHMTIQGRAWEHVWCDPSC